MAKARERRDVLTDEQIEDLRARLKDPGPIASDDEVEAFFTRFQAQDR